MRHFKVSRAASCAVIAVALCAAMSAAPAAAQEASENADSNVIIVSAQKRDQDVLEVPTAVSVVTADVIEAAQVNTFYDLARVAPAVTVNEQGNTASSSVSIRGIGTSSFSTSAEPAVSIVVDDVALLQQGQAFNGLNDIAQIEVLRGPQDSLFGKNASAGVISITTRGPTQEMSGYAEGTITDDDEFRIAAMLSGPISADGGFRLNGFLSDRKGHVTNLTNGDRLNGDRSYGFRGKLTQTAGIFDFSLTGSYTNSESAGNAPTFFTIAPGTTANGAPVDLSGITPGAGNTDVRMDLSPASSSNQHLFAAKIEADLGFATITSVTSYQNWYLDTLSDLDMSASPTTTQGGPYEATQIAQELRLTSSGSGPFTYLVGLYYADGDTDRAFVRTAPSFLSFLRQNWVSTAFTESYAGFVQLGYELTPSTTLNVGGRINHEEIGVFFSDNRTATPVVFEDTDGDTAVTGKVSLQQFVGDSTMLYASLAKGYKGQAYDISSGFNQSRIDNLVASESSIAYEAGAKGRFWENRGSFALTGFWTDYDNFQSQSAEFVGGSPQFVLRNVGKLRTRGIELEGAVEPVDGLNLFGSAAYIDATIRSFPNAACYANQTVAQGCNTISGTTTKIQDLAGADLANSPDLKFNVGGSYEAAIGESGLGAFINASYTWQDRVNFSLDRNPATEFPSYGIANATIGLRQEEGLNWELSLFVNNLFDKAYPTSLTDFTGNGYSSSTIIQQVPRNYSRYVGLRLRVGFGGE